MSVLLLLRSTAGPVTVSWIVPPSIGGSPQQGSTLTVDPGVTNIPTRFSYQWQTAAPGGAPVWSNIGGATGVTYIPVLGDVGQLIRVVVTAVDAGTSGATATTSSTSVGPVVVGAPAIHGTVHASYDLSIAWANQIFGLFQIDLSTIGGTDVLGASAWSETFRGPYDSLEANGLKTETFQVTRGRNDDLSEVVNGTAGITVMDATGILNPKRAGGPLYGSLRPQRPGRIQAFYQGGVYPLYYGFVRTLQYDPGRRIGQAKIELTDLFSWLDKPRDDGSGGSPLPVIPRMTATTTGAAIAAILDSIGWTDVSMRRLDAGDNIPFFEATGDQTPLQMIADLVTANGGIFYIDAAGRAVFEDRNTRWLRAAYATIANTMETITPGTDLDRIVNTWHAKRQYEQSVPVSFIASDGSVQFQATTLADGPDQVASDAASRAEFGVREDSVSSKYWPDDSFALGFGQWKLAKTKDPDSPLWSLTLDNRDDNQMRAILGAEIGQRMTLSEARTGTAGDYFIEQIVHNGSRTDRSHRCAMILSERPANRSPLMVDLSTIGGTDVLAF